MNDEINLVGEGRYLTFKLGEEIYAFHVPNVREVLDYTKITRVPKTPPFMKGVINLRGGVVPVVDLRLKFGLDEAEVTVDTCIIIVEAKIDGENTLLGALADQVQEVMELEAAMIEPAPRIGTRLETDFIKGMGKVEDKFLIILDIERVFSIEELTFAQHASAGAKSSDHIGEEHNLKG